VEEAIFFSPEILIQQGEIIKGLLERVNENTEINAALVQKNEAINKLIDKL
jgi:hypothetical protein